MSEEQKLKEKPTMACFVCKAGPIDKLHYVTHILGKRHQKNLKNRSKSLRKDEMNRTLHVTGFKQDTPPETLTAAFYKYEVLNVMPFPSYCFVELKTRQGVKEVLGDSHFIGDKKLKVSLKHQSQGTSRQSQGSDTPPIQLGWHLKNALTRKLMSPQSQWDTILMLISEIELKRSHYEQRELLRSNMENFLRPHFPVVSAHVFGSSANNLGFVGCDVDLYVYLGVDPWATGTKAYKEGQARDLTWYLARKLKTFNRGYQVKAIARARVPIVKFEDAMTKLQVDLSFRNGMPVYNTQLICQYTRTHILVRPYLMVIRYWAKIQDVAGGGQPTCLITNYGLTMLMLFYLMTRGQSLIPSVSYLKSQCPENVRNEHFINGWDCSFGPNVSEWTNRRHSASVMDLVGEFFSYFGSFEADKWVISPLAGQLLNKEAVKQRNLQKLPPCMKIYCSQETDLQLDTALCLQDPFEHCYNITRGLQTGPMAEFQYKCRQAAEICKGIIAGQKPLGNLFDEVYMDEEVLREILACNSPNPKEVDITQEEIITLDDSDISQEDNISQDEIEVINADTSNKKAAAGATSSTSIASVSNVSGQKKNTDAKKKEKDFSMIEKAKGEIEIEINDTNNEDSIEEILHDDTTNDSSIQEIPNGDSGIEIVKENGVNMGEENLKSSNKVSEILPENKLFKFPLDFSMTREFTITFDGSISGGKDLMTSEDDIGQAACSLIHFILQQCLKMDVTPIESASEGRKRKSESPESTVPDKRIKNADGDSVRVVLKHRRLAHYKCTAETQLWIGRRKISKTVPVKLNHNPLQYEMAVTEAQMSVGFDNEVNVIAGRLEFTITIWQEIENPSKVLVTGDSLSNEQLTRRMMMPLFIYLSSLTPNLLEKVVVYIVRTSSKR